MIERLSMEKFTFWLQDTDEARYENNFVQNLRHISDCKMTVKGNWKTFYLVCSNLLTNPER